MVNGEGQQWNPDEYDRTARFVSDLGEDALALLNPLRGEQILDLGCGDGVLTERIIQAGSRVVALDSSADQVSAACKRGVDARVGDATSLEFSDEFDAVFSNAALHWIRDHDAVLAGVYRALRPAGRFVAEFGGAGNIETVRLALVAALNRRGFDGLSYDPWYFPSVLEYSECLEGHGFTVNTAWRFLGSIFSLRSTVMIVPRLSARSVRPYAPVYREVMVPGQSTTFAFASRPLKLSTAPIQSNTRSKFCRSGLTPE